MQRIKKKINTKTLKNVSVRDIRQPPSRVSHRHTVKPEGGWEGKKTEKENRNKRETPKLFP
jgi:hypothetical protein